MAKQRGKRETQPLAKSLTLRAYSLLLSGTSANSDLPSSISELREALFLSNALLEAGHAIRYDGGAKEE